MLGELRCFRAFGARLPLAVTRPLPAALSAGLLAMLLPLHGYAQWLPQRGSGTVSIAYQHASLGDHLFGGDMSPYGGTADGNLDLGKSYSQAVNVSAIYGTWRGLAVGGGVSYITSKYAGSFPEGSIDDGQYHGAFQDATINAAYELWWHDFSIMPSAGYRFPTSGYSTLGHVSIGKNLREIPLAITVARSVDPILPLAYLSGTFTYSFVENHHEHTLDQLHYQLDGGYFVSKKIAVGMVFQYIYTVDGIDWYSDDFSDATHWHDHDAAARARFTQLGGYVSLSLGHGLGLNLTYSGTIDGENLQESRSFAVVPTWTFGKP